MTCSYFQSQAISFASCSSSFQRTTAPVLQAPVRNQAARFLSGVEMVPPDAILGVTEALKKATNELEFTAGGNTITDGAKVSGSIDSNRLKLREKWNTDNSIGATVDYEKLMPGLKLTLDSSFQPNTGDKAGKFKTEYKHEKLIFNADRGKASHFHLINYV